MNQREKELQARLREALFAAAPDRFADLPPRAVEPGETPLKTRFPLGRLIATAACLLFCLSAAGVYAALREKPPVILAADSSEAGAATGGPPESTATGTLTGGRQTAGALITPQKGTGPSGDTAGTRPQPVGSAFRPVEREVAQAVMGMALRMPSDSRFEELQIKESGEPMVQYRYKMGTILLRRDGTSLDRDGYKPVKTRGREVYVRQEDNRLLLLDFPDGLHQGPVFSLSFTGVSLEESLRLLAEIA